MGKARRAPNTQASDPRLPMRPKKKARRPVGPEKKLRTPSFPQAPGDDPTTDGPPSGRALVLTERVEESFPLPELLPLLPLRTDVVFPQTVVPLVVNRTGGIKMIDDVLAGDK